MTTTTPSHFIYRSDLPAERVQAILRAQVNQYPPTRLYTKREINYPEVIVRATPSHFELSQRKTYVNLWGSLFVVQVHEGEGSTVIVEADRVNHPWRERFEGLFHLALATGSGGLVYCALRWAFVALSSSEKILLVVSFASILAAMALMQYYFWYCEKHYHKLATGEESLIHDFLQTKLDLQPLEPSVVSPGAEPMRSEIPQ